MTSFPHLFSDSGALDDFCKKDEDEIAVPGQNNETIEN